MSLVCTAAFPAPALLLAHHSCHSLNEIQKLGVLHYPSLLSNSVITVSKYAKTTTTLGMQLELSAWLEDFMLNFVLSRPQRKHRHWPGSKDWKTVHSQLNSKNGIHLLMQMSGFLLQSRRGWAAQPEGSRQQFTHPRADMLVKWITAD